MIRVDLNENKTTVFYRKKFTELKSIHDKKRDEAEAGYFRNGLD